MTIDELLFTMDNLPLKPPMMCVNPHIEDMGDDDQAKIKPAAKKKQDRAALDLKIAKTKALYLSALSREWKSKKSIAESCNRHPTQIHFHMEAFIADGLVKKMLVKTHVFKTAYYRLSKSTKLQKD